MCGGRACIAKLWELVETTLSVISPVRVSIVVTNEKKPSGVTEPINQIAIDFAGPFQNAISARKYLLVSIDHHSGWPDAKFFRKPTAEKIIEF